MTKLTIFLALLAACATSTDGARGKRGDPGAAGGQGGAGGSEAPGGAPDSRCGDGVREGEELCDGRDFGGATCQSMGYSAGELECDARCLLVPWSCLAEVCGNSADDDGDFAVDCDDEDCAESVSCADPCAAPLAVNGLPAYQGVDLTGRPSFHQATCGSARTSDWIVSWVAPSSAVYQVSAFPALGRTAAAGTAGSLSVRTQCASAASEVECASMDEFEGGAIELTAVAGQKYFFLLEGHGYFALQFREPCNPGAPACSLGGKCVDDGLGTCFVPCTSTADCIAGFECNDSYGVGSTYCN